MKLAGTVAVVTGAGSGIGRALAVALGLAGARVVLAGRSREALEETTLLLGGYGIEHVVIPVDVTSNASIQELIQRALEKYGSINIFINNAGVGLFESITKSKWEDMEMIFKTNFWGPIAAMQCLAQKAPECLVVNISSAAAKYAPYQQGVYAASKAALERVTESVDLEEKNMKTLLVIPNRTNTPFMQNILGPKENAGLAFGLKSASAEGVARTIVRAIRKRPASLLYDPSKSRLRRARCFADRHAHYS